MRSPKLYATFLLWLLAELFETLPEVGDPEKPKLVFFFDEAHLLFDDAPKALQDKIEQVVRLIRSKGVGVFFVTQNPIDIPEEVAGQLGNRVQHALRAFTPRDQRAIKAAAETFRINPDLDVETAITELKVGEALVSTLLEDGAPSMVQRTLIKPPRSRLGPVSEKERAIIQLDQPARWQIRSTGRPGKRGGSAGAKGRRRCGHGGGSGRKGARGSRQARAQVDQHLGQGSQARRLGRGGIGRYDRRQCGAGQEVTVQPDAQCRHLSRRFDCHGYRRAVRRAVSCAI